MCDIHEITSEEEKEEQRGVQKEGFENKVEEQQPVVGQETQR